MFSSLYLLSFLLEAYLSTRFNTLLRIESKSNLVWAKVHLQICLLSWTNDFLYIRAQGAQEIHLGKHTKRKWLVLSALLMSWCIHLNWEEMRAFFYKKKRKWLLRIIRCYPCLKEDLWIAIKGKQISMRMSGLRTTPYLSSIVDQTRIGHQSILDVPKRFCQRPIFWHLKTS
jgi:hypothetical protein